MEGKQRLYYALGQLAYLVAKADGKIQKEEQERLNQLIAEEIQRYDNDYGISNIIFQLLENSAYDANDIFDRAFADINSASYYLKDDMKTDFMAFLEKIARAFPPITEQEKYWLERIKIAIEKV